VKRKNVFVTRAIPDAGLELLRRDCDLEVNPHDRVLTKSELMRAVAGRDGVLCLLTDAVDADVLAAAKGAKVFANYAVGFNNIDVAAATKLGIAVTNTPGVLTDATADMAWALLMAIARRVVESDKFARAGKFDGWAPKMFIGGDITGRTIGLIGAGRIGGAVAQRAKGFDMKILYHNRSRSADLEKNTGAKYVSLNELLEQSDYVSLHCPSTPETHHLINATTLRKMKPKAYLINTARGPVVDEKALVVALRERVIAGAALDVFEHEPAIEPGLKELDNVVICPHIASATEQTRDKMATMAATNLLYVLRGETPPNLLNPEVLKAP
jgi:lactate dehydrogenase-like 2-hydroxyacid dehydrogenase